MIIEEKTYTITKSQLHKLMAYKKELSKSIQEVETLLYAPLHMRKSTRRLHDLELEVCKIRRDYAHAQYHDYYDSLFSDTED